MQGAFLSGVQNREELWLASCVNDIFPTQHNSASPRGGPWQGCGPQLSATVGCAAGIRWGMVVRWVPRRAKPRPGAALLCIAAGPKTDCEPPVDNICRRDCTICPRPGGRSSLLLGQMQGPQTWTRAVVQRQRTQPRHSQSCWGLVQFPSCITVYNLQGVIVVRFK